MGLWDSFVSGAGEVVGEVGESAGQAWDATTSAVKSGVDEATKQWIKKETRPDREQPQVTGWEGIAPGKAGLLGQGPSSGQQPSWDQPRPQAANEPGATPTPPGAEIPWKWIAGAGAALVLGLVGFAAVRGS